MTESVTRRDWLRIAVYIGVIALLSWGALESARRMDDQLDKLVPETVSDASTSNKRPSGYKAFYELCQRSGLAPRLWETSYRELARKEGVLVVVAPVIPLAGYEVDQVAEFVKRGNRLVYLDYFGFQSGRKLLSKFGLTARDSQSLTDGEFEVSKTFPAGQYVKKLLLSGETRLDGGKKVAGDAYGALVVETELGKGKCLVIASPGMCANRRIADPESKGNFQFIVNWLGETDGPVMIDEKCHGHSIAPNLLSYLAHGPAGLATAQLVLIFLVAVVSLNQRFGAAEQFVKLRKIANLEFIEGMAQTFRKARARDTAAHILFHSFKTRLCKALGVSPEVAEDVLASAWSGACQIPEKECLDFLSKGSALQKGETKLSADEMISFTRELDRLVASSRSGVNLARRLGA